MKNRNYVIGAAVIVIVVAGLVLALYLTKPSLCYHPDVSAVFSCTDGSFRTVFRGAGTGYEIIRPDGSEVICPVIAQPSDECMVALDTCSDVNLC
jgi:hypothetical protein